MKEVYICDALRTPVGRYGGALSSVRPDDLAAIPIKALAEKNPSLDISAIDDVVLGCANQAGEDNRNIARMALLLAGLPAHIPGVTTNRLCGSGMDAVAIAARAIKSGEADLMVAGGVESMSRAPYVMDKADQPFSRKINLYDTTIGWRFVNKTLDRMYGSEAMAETAENIAREHHISRYDQDVFALWSQEKASLAQASGLLSTEIIPVSVSHRHGDTVVTSDEHPRPTSLEKLSALKPITSPEGTVTAGNASGINDGAAAILVASEEAVRKHNLNPMARVVGSAVAGILPRVMGLGPVPATNMLLKRVGLSLKDIDIVEINEAFAVQALGCIRQMKMQDRDPRINPRGGAIALGHPLGMSGARLVTTAVHQLTQSGMKRALCTMCIGVGQGISMIIERC